jgi:hypothetical protein
VTFRLLMTGWVLLTRHRYVTDLIGSSDSVGHGHFSDDHRFFSQAAWKINNLWRLLAKLIIDRLIGKDAVIAHPWFAPSKVFSLPICMRLYRNRQGLTKGKNKTAKRLTATQKRAASKEANKTVEKKERAKAKAKKNRQGSKIPHKTRPELLAAWFPDRKFVLVVDSLYSGKSVLSKLPGNFDLIGPVHPQAALDADRAARRAKVCQMRSRGKKIRHIGPRITSTSMVCMDRCKRKRTPDCITKPATIACCAWCFRATRSVIVPRVFSTARMST